MFNQLFVICHLMSLFLAPLNFCNQIVELLTFFDLILSLSTIFFRRILGFDVLLLWFLANILLANLIITAFEPCLCLEVHSAVSSVVKSTSFTPVLVDLLFTYWVQEIILLLLVYLMLSKGASSHKSILFFAVVHIYIICTAHLQSELITHFFPLCLAKTFILKNCEDFTVLLGRLVGRHYCKYLILVLSVNLVLLYEVLSLLFSHLLF